MVTQDADFAELHLRWQLAGQKHHGIMRLPPFLQGEAQISFAVRELLFYHMAAGVGAVDVASEIENRIIYL